MFVVGSLFVYNFMAIENTDWGTWMYVRASIFMFLFLVLRWAFYSRLEFFRKERIEKAKK